MAPAHVPFSLPVAESNASLPPAAGDPPEPGREGGFPSAGGAPGLGPGGFLPPAPAPPPPGPPGFSFLG